MMVSPTDTLAFLANVTPGEGRQAETGFIGEDVSR